MFSYEQYSLKRSRRRERRRNSSSSKQTGPPLDAKFKDIFAVCCVVPPPTLQVATWVNCVGRRNHRHRCRCHCCYWCCCCWRLVVSFFVLGPTKNCHMAVMHDAQKTHSKQGQMTTNEENHFAFQSANICTSMRAKGVKGKGSGRGGDSCLVAKLNFYF